MSDVKRPTVTVFVSPPQVRGAHPAAGGPWRPIRTSPGPLRPFRTNLFLGQEPRSYAIRDKLRIRAHSMLLAREFVAYISKQLVKSLSPGTIETPTPDLVAEKLSLIH